MIRRLLDWLRGYTDDDLVNVAKGCIPNTPGEWAAWRAQR